MTRTQRAAYHIAAVEQGCWSLWQRSYLGGLINIHLAAGKKSTGLNLAAEFGYDIVCGQLIERGDGGGNEKASGL